MMKCQILEGSHYWYDPLVVPEAGRSRSRSQQIWFPVRTVHLAFSRPPHHLLIRLLLTHGHGREGRGSLLSLQIRMLLYRIRALSVWPHVASVVALKLPFPNVTTAVGRASTYKFGKNTNIRFITSVLKAMSLSHAKYIHFILTAPRSYLAPGSTLKAQVQSLNSVSS